MNTKLTVVSAPAGSGKTTLLAEWVARGRAPTAWISLDAGDNDPAVFVAYLIAALQGLRPGAYEDALDLLLRSPRPAPVEAVTTMLVNEISSREEDFALVMDDYHLIRSEEVHRTVGYLLRHLPARMHLFLASRTDPPLPVARLLAGGELTRLDAPDMRFTPEEASLFLGETMSLDLPSEEVAALYAKTEGWAAGLQLAAISVRQTERLPELDRDPAGTNRHLLDYLAEEVLDNQDEEVRGFLLRTSVLGRMCAPLCEAVTGRGAGQEMLERLERANLFVVPLDDERRWYRYHHLFADFLSRRLGASAPEELAGLHRNARVWFERNGLTSEAVSHALAAGDPEKAADLVEKVARTTLRRGELSTLRGWLEALPEGLVSRRSRLCLFCAWYSLAAGELAAVEPYLARAEKAAGIRGADGHAPREPEDLDPDAREVAGEATTIRAAVAGLEGASARAVELAGLASGLLTGENQFLRCIIAASLGYAHRAEGEVAEAIRGFTEAAEVSRSVGATYVTLLAYKHLAELRTVQGRLRAASDVCDLALEFAGERGGGLPAASVAHVGMGELLREWDELGSAARHLEKGIELGERGGNSETVLDGYLSLARVRQAAGDRDGCVAALRGADRLAEALGRGDWALRVAAWRARLDVARGDLRAADRWMEDRGDGTREELCYPREFEHVTSARMLVAGGEREGALNLLERLLGAAEAGGRGGRVVEILVVRAVAQGAEGDGSGALAALGRAAALAEAEGYVRIFADEGAPMAAMLKRLQREARRRVAGGVSAGYVAKLLSAMGEGSSPVGTRGTAGPLIEPLSEREHEVLALVAEGISNQEIAGRLFISLDTVKSHLKRLYGKLGVHSRTQAVARAKESGLF